MFEFIESEDGVTSVLAEPGELLLALSLLRWEIAKAANAMIKKNETKNFFIMF